MPRPTLLPLLTLTLLATPAAADVPAELRGSPASMVRQHEIAVDHSFTFLNSPEQVEDYVAKGRLVELPGNRTYELAKVSFPYVRPVTKAFVERFAADYYQACGTPMVVTSATRPSSTQPANAHNLSVHPTGMAVDLRVPQESECRKWTEEALLALEKDGVLDVTLERRPPHLHVAIFPGAVPAYLAKAGPAPALPPEPGQAVAQAPAGEPAAVAVPAAVDADAEETRAESEDTSMATVLFALLALVGLPLALILWLRRGRTPRPVEEPLAAVPHEGDESATTPPLEIRVERRDRAA